MGLISSIIYGTVSLIASAYMTFFPMFVSRSAQEIESQKTNSSFFSSDRNIQFQNLDAIVDGEPCESLEFISDVTYPDGSVIEAGKTFVKKWEVKNDGCDLNESNPAFLTYLSGTTMGAQRIPIPYIKSGETAIISTTLKAPTIPGTDYRVSYIGTVQDNGISRPFGQEVWAQISVEGLSYNSKFIVVDIDNQLLHAFYQGRHYSFSASTGISGRDTPLSDIDNPFRIWLKTPLQDMDGTQYGYDYYLPDVPWDTYVVGGVAIHGTYWHNNFGHKMSSGCINLSVENAKWVFDRFNLGDEVYIVQSIADFPVDFFSDSTPAPEYATPATREHEIPQWKMDMLEMR